MAVLKAVCLDGGKVEVMTASIEKDRTVHGLCDDCYQRLLEQDPKLARWAFKGDDQATSKK
ncbi:MAG: hypothetical protein Q8P22_08875 [Chloroflexota bacterium]|nr:hypothetical protein [Chloroflexota bacterium]